jgi:anthranilate synthase component 2
MRNDAIDFEKVEAFSRVVISPGPALPKDAGQLMRFLKENIEKKPILGICLGHQAIAEHFGVPLKNLKDVVHGQATSIQLLSQEGLFKDIPASIKVGRYHSWVVDKEKMADNLLVTAIDKEKHIMAFQHTSLPVVGLQFHPESILTEYGEKMIANWLAITY